MPERVSWSASRSLRSVAAIGGIVAARRLAARARLAVAHRPVVGDLLPRDRVVEVLAVGRPDAGIAVERAQAQALPVAVVGIEAPQRRAAGRAERLDEAVRWRVLA